MRFRPGAFSDPSRAEALREALPYPDARVVEPQENDRATRPSGECWSDMPSRSKQLPLWPPT